MQKNSFDEIRILLALTVVMAHVEALSGQARLDWITEHFDSDFAVKGFFAISGYLVTKSFLSSENSITYFEKRARRIYPGYVLAVIYGIFVGALTTNLNLTAFLLNTDTIKYIAANLLFLNFLHPTLPGSLDGNALRAVNGSLWTIKVEVMLYIMVPVLMLGYRSIGRIATFLSALFFGIGWVYITQHLPGRIGIQLSHQFPSQLPFFSLGSLLSFYAPSKRVTYISIAAGLIYFYIKSIFPLSLFSFTNMIVYPIFVILICKGDWLSLGIGKFGDFSYGAYLMHFPTIQILTYFGVFSRHPNEGLILTFVGTLALSYISWRFVEKPWLKRSSHYIQATE